MDVGRIQAFGKPSRECGGCKAGRSLVADGDGGARRCIATQGIGIPRSLQGQRVLAHREGVVSVITWLVFDDIIRVPVLVGDRTRPVGVRIG